MHRGFNPITTLGSKTRTLFFLFVFLVFENIVVIICFVLSQSGNAVKYLEENRVKPGGKTSHAIKDNKTTHDTTLITTFTGFYNQFTLVSVNYLQTKNIGF